MQYDRAGGGSGPCSSCHESGLRAHGHQERGQTVPSRCPGRPGTCPALDARALGRPRRRGRTGPDRAGARL